MESEAFLAALGRRVRDLRERKGLSQDALAGESGVADHTLQKLELAQANTGIGTLYKVCNGLGIQPVELFEGMATAETAKDKRKVIDRIARLCAEQDLDTVEAIEKVVKTALTSGLKVS